LSLQKQKHITGTARENEGGRPSLQKKLGTRVNLSRSKKSAETASAQDPAKGRGGKVLQSWKNAEEWAGGKESANDVEGTYNPLNKEHETR